MTETNVPRLRFKEFSGEWSEKKLNEVADRVTRKNKNLDSDLPLTISAQYGLVDQEIFFNKKVASKDLSNYFLVKRGEFAYNKSYSNGYPFGTIKSLKRYDMGVLSSLYIVFSIKENISHLFMDSFFDSNHWHKEVSTKTTEGARNHGLLNISPQDFMKSKIFVPNNIEEQNRIGLFISNLDNLIELQTQKLEQLKKLKQGYLQKMFPQEGELEPRLRFSGFSGDWKEEELGNVVLYEQPTKYIVKSNEYSKEFNVPVLTAGKNFLLGYTNELENVKEASETNPLIIFDDFTTSSHYVNFSFKIKSSAMKFLKATHNNDTYFMYCVLENINYFPTTHSRQWISNYSKMTVRIPNCDEQNRISSFLKKIDQMIKYQSHKIESLKQQKKAYLQKMFI